MEGKAMTAADALRVARAAGIDIGIDGDDLVLEASSAPPDAVFDTLSRNKEGIIALLRPNGDGWSPEDWQAFFDERAGIAEFDGGQTREAAEARALECCVVEWLNRHPQQSDPGHCAWCRTPEHDGHTVDPFGVEEYGYTWLHHECWGDWRDHRREQARQELTSLGIGPPY
jgi:hypothetical protein